MLMFRRTWLLIDVNFLAHRAFHSTGELSHNGKSTGVYFGVIRDLVTFSDFHNSSKFVFCFDGRNSLRKNIFPGYKNRVISKDKSFIDQRAAIKDQIKGLKDNYLPYLGYENIFYQDGYEADDCIASVAMNLGEEDGIIISSDKDFYQLLRSGNGNGEVICWDPNQKKAMTERGLKKEYGVTPQQWIEVKALAGCKSDKVPGLPGIGEITAARYLTGKLETHLKAHKIICDNLDSDALRRNRELVTLPYSGVNKFKLKDDKTFPSLWKQLYSELGITTLKVPMTVGE